MPLENRVMVSPDQLASNIAQEFISHSCLKYTGTLIYLLSPA